MTPHAMLNSAYPPSEDSYFPQTIEQDIALMLCHGDPYDEVYTYYTQDPEDDPWQDRETDIDPQPESLEELIRMVSEEYKRAVPHASEDATKIAGLEDAFTQRNLAWSFDEGWDKGEAAQDGVEKAREINADGYAYCTLQDVDGLIHTGTLYIGYSSTSAQEEETCTIGHRVCEVLKEQGLNPTWDGNTGARIECSGLRYELALDDDFPSQ